MGGADPGSDGPRAPYGPMGHSYNVGPGPDSETQHLPTGDHTCVPSDSTSTERNETCIWRATARHGTLYSRIAYASILLKSEIPHQGKDHKALTELVAQHLGQKLRGEYTEATRIGCAVI